jgi:tripartite-type tricarboxylate transporter receptor subunit TctC
VRKKCTSWAHRACRVPAHAAAQDYPIHSVTILVPFPPGGGTDMIARASAQNLSGVLASLSSSGTPAYRR